MLEWVLDGKYFILYPEKKKYLGNFVEFVFKSKHKLIYINKFYFLWGLRFMQSLFLFIIIYIILCVLCYAIIAFINILLAFF